jgi:hypothetical protein
MRRRAIAGIYLLMAIVGCANTPSPEWIRVMETGSQYDRFVTYADRSSISRSGDTARMLSVVDSAVAPDGNSEKLRVSWKDDWEYECRRQQQRPREYTEYAGRMGTGEKMMTFSVADIFWYPVPPGSLGEALWKIACGKD